VGFLALQEALYLETLRSFGISSGLKPFVLRPYSTAESQFMPTVRHYHKSQQQLEERLQGAYISSTEASIRSDNAVQITLLSLP